MMTNPHGIYRIPGADGVPACIWVRGSDGATFKVAEERYRLNKYTPKIDELPTEEEYSAGEDG